MIKRQEQEKRAAYEALIEDVKKYYENGVEGGYYTKIDTVTKQKTKDFFKLKWCPECKEINLWTYWQGKENPNLQADILLLGQDWATVWENNRLLPYVARVLDGKSGFSKRYIEEIKKLSTPTDGMLQEMMSVLGEAYNPAKDDNEKLFFSNLCLGYRDHGDSGGLNKKALEHDVQYIERLIEIVEPKLIICLGKDTYEAFVKMTKSIPDAPKTSFYKRLADGKCHAVYKGAKGEIPVCGQAHTGRLGAMNRCRFDPNGYKYSEENSKKLLAHDWKLMKQFLK